MGKLQNWLTKIRNSLMGETPKQEEEEEEQLDEDQLCVICFENPKNVILRCGHCGFCRTCINAWKNKVNNAPRPLNPEQEIAHPKCPICWEPLKIRCKTRRRHRVDFYDGKTPKVDATPQVEQITEIVV